MKDLETYTDLDILELFDIDDDYIDVDLSSENLEQALIDSLGVQKNGG